jgi:hypothetical protein
MLFLLRSAILIRWHCKYLLVLPNLKQACEHTTNLRAFLLGEIKRNGTKVDNIYSYLVNLKDAIEAFDIFYILQ